jgi:hypothetical protein
MFFFFKKKKTVCRYRLVQRFKESVLSTSSNQAGLFERVDAQGRATGPVVLVFRGSGTAFDGDTFKDWANNMRLFPSKCTLPLSGATIGRCHSGFERGLQSLEAHMGPLRATLALAKRNGASEILVGGSSLGAALATIAALDLITAVKRSTATKAIKIKLVTHGSPRAGTSDFVKALDRGLAYSARYVAVSPCVDEQLRMKGRRSTAPARDLITRLPWLWAGYRHIAGAKVVPCLQPCAKIRQRTMTYNHRYTKLAEIFQSVFSEDDGGDEDKNGKSSNAPRTNMLVNLKCHFSYTESLWTMYRNNRGGAMNGIYIRYDGGSGQTVSIATFEELAHANRDDARDEAGTRTAPRIMTEDTPTYVEGRSEPPVTPPASSSRDNKRKVG